MNPEKHVPEEKKVTLASLTDEYSLHVVELTGHINNLGACIGARPALKVEPRTKLGLLNKDLQNCIETLRKLVQSVDEIIR
jgi:hypothetical protein